MTAHLPVNALFRFAPFICGLVFVTISALSYAYETSSTYPSNISFNESKSATQLNERLPSLGSEAALISSSEERRLGRAWLRKLRNQAPSYYNPLLNEYLSNLIYQLAPNSQIENKDFILTVLDSPKLNAFAVPGSVVGINAGLLLYTRTEDELAAVLAHELAHLSLRHFARQLEHQKQTAPLRLAGFLATIALLASNHPDIGTAAYASTQALSADNQLRFSRKNEQEADRIGIQILYESGFDPLAMPGIFEQMYKLSGGIHNALPEYLSTHPLSQSRISDTRARAQGLTPKHYHHSLYFQFIRAMIESDYAQSKAQASAHFQSQIGKYSGTLADSARFGFAYSVLDSQPAKALEELKKLNEKYPDNLIIEVTTANAMKRAGQTSQAIDYLKQQLLQTPDNYALSMTLAEHLFASNRTKECVQILQRLTHKYPDDPVIWFQLAEAHGISGNIVQVHIARSEYFFQIDRLNDAIRQLEIALEKSHDDLLTAKIHERLKQFTYYKKHPLL